MSSLYSIDRLAVLLFLIMFLAGHSIGGEAQNCTLKSSNPGKDLGSVCSYDRGGDEIFNLKECRAIDGAESVLYSPACQKIIPQGTCEVVIELAHFTSFANFNLLETCTRQSNKAAQPTLNITLKSVSQSLQEGLILFRNIAGLSISSFELADCSQVEIKSLKSFLQDNLRPVRRLGKLTISKLDEQPTPLWLENVPNVERIELADSKLSGIASESFVLEPPVRELILRDLDLQALKVQKGAISKTLACNSGAAAAGLSISINRCGLTNAMLEKGFIELRSDPAGCASRPTLRLDLRDNELGGVVQEQIFGPLVNEIDSSLRLDPLTCCDKDNLWLFNSTKSKKAKSKRQITDEESRFLESTSRKDSKYAIEADCADLGATVTSIEDLTDLCNRRNVYPIALIAIMTILLLAFVMGIFACVCMFYVLPRKRMLSQLRMATQIPSYKTEKSNSTGSGHMTPIAEARSTGTAMTDAEQPVLMSEQSRTQKQESINTIRSLMPSAHLKKTFAAQPAGTPPPFVAAKVSDAIKSPEPQHESSPKSPPKRRAGSSSPGPRSPKNGKAKNKPGGPRGGSAGPSSPFHDTLTRTHETISRPSSPNHGPGPRGAHQAGSSPKSPRHAHHGSSPRSPGGSSPKHLGGPSSPLHGSHGTRSPGSKPRRRSQGETRPHKSHEAGKRSSPQAKSS